MGAELTMRGVMMMNYIPVYLAMCTNVHIACGGWVVVMQGGGYSMVQKHTRKGLVPVLVAGGGGGGGTRAGMPGGGLHGELPGLAFDKRGGRMGTDKEGGMEGSCTDILGSRFKAQKGSAWQGGNGCDYGGGGGGGFFGGGGGGTSPGIAGGGGGGSSYVNTELVMDYVVLQGEVSDQFRH